MMTKLMILGLAAGLCTNAFALSATDLTPVRTVPHELDVLVKSGHIQGAACSEEGVYLSHQDGIEMVGWDGHLIRRVDAPAHLGDIAYADGRVYGAFCLRGEARRKYRSLGLIRVWNAKLEMLKEKTVNVNLDGAVVLDGTLYVGVDKWGRDLHDGCCVRMFDLDLNEKGEKTIDLGYKIAYGVQTMATDGKDLFFGNYGGASRVSADLNETSKIALGCAEGFGLVPKSVSKRETPVFFVVRALGGNMQGWRSDQTNNPPQIELRFFDYGGGKFSVCPAGAGSRGRH